MNHETIMAARLICEASDLCGDQEVTTVNGVDVHRPRTDLASKARKVLEVSESGENMEEVVREFIEALDTNS